MLLCIFWDDLVVFYFLLVSVGFVLFPFDISMLILCIHGFVRLISHFRILYISCSTGFDLCVYIFKSNDGQYKIDSLYRWLSVRLYVTYIYIYRSNDRY